MDYEIWGYATRIKSIMSINIKLIADIVFSVAAILNFNLDYEKKIVYSLGNGFI